MGVFDCSLQREKKTLHCWMNSFTAHRRDGKIVLEIDERDFLADAMLEKSENLTVVDPDRFLSFALAHLFTLTHDIDEESHPTWWQRLTQALAKVAASTGDGVRRIEAAVPVCHSDPEKKA
jgi:hypothetical protein